MNSMLFFLGALAMVVAVVVDLASFILGVKRLRGDGPSGLPLVGAMLFALGLLLLGAVGSLQWSQACRYGLAYATAHVLIQFGLLALLHLFLPNRRQSGR